MKPAIMTALLTSAAIVSADRLCPSGYHAVGNKGTTTPICVAMPPPGAQGPAGPQGPPGPPGPAGGGGGIPPNDPVVIQPGVGNGVGTVHLGSYFMDPFVASILGDNQEVGVGSFSFYNYSSAAGIETDPPGGRAGAVMNHMPYEHRGTMQVFGTGHSPGIASRAMVMVDDPIPPPVVSVLPVTDGSYAYPAGQCMGYTGGLRVTGTNGRTVRSKIRNVSCPPTTPCRFKASYPYGRCINPNVGSGSGAACGITEQGATLSACVPPEVCEYDRSWFDRRPTRAWIAGGGCAPKTREQHYAWIYSELRTPKDSVELWNMNERPSVPMVSYTGYLIMSTTDPIAGYSVEPAPGQTVYNKMPIWMDPPGTVARRYGEVVAVRANPDGSGGDETPHVGSSFCATALPTFAHDFDRYCDCAGTCVQLLGFTGAASIVAVPDDPTKCGELSLRFGPSGLLRDRCDGVKVAVP